MRGVARKACNALAPMNPTAATRRCVCIESGLSFPESLATADAAGVGQNPAALYEYLKVEPENAQCVELACAALLDAVRDYSNAARDDWAGDEALICTCFFVSERTIEREIQAKGLTTVAEVTKACNAGAGCGSCHQLIQEILETV